MVAPALVAFDIVSVAVSVLLPGAAWALLFGLAWRYPGFAESLGLGRRAFWLLLPGALAATFVVLPIVPVARDIVGVSFAGAVFPLLVGTLALGRVSPPLGRTLGVVFSALGIESATMLLVVLPPGADTVGRFGASVGLATPVAVDLVAALAGVGVSVAVAAFLGFGREDAARRPLAIHLGTSAVLILTFLGSTAIAGVGIVETFPYFLLPPAGAGIVMALVAGRVFPREEAYALPAAFFAGTWGTIVGADLLRQPGLYGTGPAGFYVIGGAGVLDLVYLSGFLALIGAFAVHAALGRGFEPVGPSTPTPPTSPTGRLREAYELGLKGELTGALRASADAAAAAAGQARRLQDGGPEGASVRPWDGLPVPGWVVSDQANLESSARAGTVEPLEALRGWLTARWLVLLGRELSAPRFASPAQRGLAFVLDLFIVLGGSAALLAALAAATPGSLSDLLGGVAYNAAIYGCITVGFLYFVATELAAGRTVGKRWVGLEVRDRRYARPDGLACTVRNVTLVPTLTLGVLGAGLGVGILTKGLTSVDVGGLGVLAGLLALGVIGAFVLGGIALLGTLGLFAASLSAERQRVGDAWAGTWVVRTTTTAAPAGPASTSQGPPGPSG